MSDTTFSGNQISDGETTWKRRRSADSEEEQYPVDEEPELRATVELEVQGTVDTNHPDAQRESLTRMAEERMIAREQEIQRTHDRFDRRADSDREARSRAAAARGSRDRRRAFQRRAVAVDPSADPDTPDPRVQLSQEQLATVNREATRLSDELEEWSRAAISRRLAERIVNGDDAVTAVVRVVNDLQTAPGTIIPIDSVSEVSRRTVSVEGRVNTLWKPSHHAIQQVGLVGDETGRIRFTIWKASKQPLVDEGEQVAFRQAKKNWHRGRCSIALTRRSRIRFPERESWITE